MKKLLILLASVIGWAAPLAAFPITGYVQISTGPVQAGGFSTQTGTVGTFTDTGLPANQCVQTTAGGLLSTTGGQCSAGGGSGGASTLQTTWSGVQITSPTSSENFNNPQFVLAAIGSTTTVALNPSSVTLQGNNLGATYLSQSSAAVTYAPISGSGNYIQNGTGVQTATFNTTSGTITGPFNATNVESLNGYTQRGTQILNSVGGNLQVGIGAGGTSGAGLNTSVGTSALGSSVNGRRSVAVGYGALGTENGSGIMGNTAVGYFACDSNVTGTGNSCFGDGADVASNNLTAATAIGVGAVVQSSSTIQLGEAGIMVTASSLTVSNLASGQCVQTGAGGTLTTTGSACGAGGGGGSTNGTIVASPQFQVPYYSLSGTTTTLTGMSGVTTLSGNDIELSTITVSSGTATQQWQIGGGNTYQGLIYPNPVSPNGMLWEFDTNPAPNRLKAMYVLYTNQSIGGSLKGMVIEDANQNQVYAIDPNTPAFSARGKVILSSSTLLNGEITISSGIILSGTEGTNGQVITSGGPGTAPTWTTISGGGGGGSSTSTVLINGVILSSPTTSYNYIPGSGELVTGSVYSPNGVSLTFAADTSVMLSRATDQSNTDKLCVSANGNTTYSCNLLPALTQYTTGQCVTLLPDVGNPVFSTATLNINTLGTKSIFTFSGAALSTGAINAGMPLSVCLSSPSSTGWIIQGGSGSGSAGTVTNVSAGTGISVANPTTTPVITNTGVLSISSTSVGGTPITGATQLLPGSNVTLTQSGQSITIASSGGGGSSASGGFNYCPPEFGGCGITPSNQMAESSATVYCDGFWGSVAGASSISISSVSWVNATGSSNTAVGFYNSSGNLIAQSTTTIATNVTNTVIFPPSLTLNAGSFYYLCKAADGTMTDYASTSDQGYLSQENCTNIPASACNYFKATNTSTVNAGGLVILPSSLGTHVALVGGQFSLPAYVIH